MDDWELEREDELFFGIPEDEGTVGEVDYIWENLETDQEQVAVFGEAVDTSSKASKSSKSKSKAKNASKEPRLQCPHCNRTYASERTLKTHLNSVALKDILRRAPDLNGLVAKMKDLVIAALKEVSKKLEVGDLAKKCATYANTVCISIERHDSSELLIYISNVFIDCFKIHEIVFLSSIREKFTSGTNKLLNTTSFRVKVKELFNKISECPDCILNYFIGNFIMELSAKVVIFVCQNMRGKPSDGDGPKKHSKDNFSSLKFKRIVHYIAGSVVCGLNRRRKNYPASVHLVTFGRIMNETFVEDKDDDSTLCGDDIKEWTSTQNRGGLCFVSKIAFDFFYELCCVVICHEEHDGSLLIDKVNTSVSKNHKLLNLWDMLIGSALSEEHSLEWLSSIVEIVCRCISKGIIKRRLNEALKKPVSNVAHRAKLAR